MSSRKSRAPRLGQVYPVPKSQPVDVVIPCSAGTREVFVSYYHCKSASLIPGVRGNARGLVELCEICTSSSYACTSCVSRFFVALLCARQPILFPLPRGGSLGGVSSCTRGGIYILDRVERRGRGRLSRGRIYSSNVILTGMGRLNFLGDLYEVNECYDETCFLGTCYYTYCFVLNFRARANTRKTTIEE